MKIIVLTILKCKTQQHSGITKLCRSHPEWKPGAYLEVTPICAEHLLLCLQVSSAPLLIMFSQNPLLTDSSPAGSAQVGKNNRKGDPDRAVCLRSLQEVSRICGQSFWVGQPCYLQAFQLPLSLGEGASCPSPPLLAVRRS